jgi:hypothetical protein
MVDFPIGELLGVSLCLIWLERHLYAEGFTCPRPPLSGLRGLLHIVDGHGLRKDAATTGHAGAVAAWNRQGRADGPPGAS